MKRMYDYGVLLACIAGLVTELYFPSCSFKTSLGVLGAVYCLYYLFVFVFCPIRRDWIIVRGRFLLRVVNFVLLVPFVITLYITATDNDSVLCHGHEEPASLVQESCSAEKEDNLLFWTVYCHFTDAGNQIEASASERRLVAIIALLGFFLLNGLLISTLISWFDRRREQWGDGEIRYGWFAFGWKRRVAVVIGANEFAPAIIKKILRGEGEKSVKYIVLLTNEDVGKVRDQISSYLTDKEERRVVVYKGQLDSVEEIYRLHIKWATEIYVLGENSESDVSHSYHDTQNMRCVHNIANYLSDKCVQRRIVCRVLFEYQTTYSVFQFSDLPENIRKHLVFIPFNEFENWAQRVLVKGEYSEPIKKVLRPAVSPAAGNLPADDESRPQAKTDDGYRTILYTPLDGNGISHESREHVHLVIVGMSKMGVAMAIQAAQLAHYPNFSTGRWDDEGNVLREPSLIRTRITFIDENADKEMHFFMGRFQNLFALSRYRYIDASGTVCSLTEPWIDPMAKPGNKHARLGDNFLDVEWEFVRGNVQTPAVMEYMRDAASQASGLVEAHSLLTVAICHPLAHEAIASALYMPGEVYDNAQQILVYQREAADIVYNLGCEKDKVYTHKRYAKLRPFGMEYADFSTDKDVFYRALICNYVYEKIFDEDTECCMIPEIIRNMDLANRHGGHVKAAMDAWKELPIFNKWSNRYLGNSFETKLRSIGCGSLDIVLDYGLICSCISENKDYLAECEHNRWNVQQLLMGFRAYRDDELDRFLALRDNAGISENSQADFKKFKDRMKASPEKVHLNICSTDMLHRLDSAAEGYDEIFNSSIPAIISCIERLNAERNEA